MSLILTLIAIFLYTEMLIVLALALPIITPNKWQLLFQSEYLHKFTKRGSAWFSLILGVLFLYLAESARETNKYTTPAHLNIELQNSVRLFRAQRNLYISGYAMFLLLVIRRMIDLITEQATLLTVSKNGFADMIRTLIAEQDSRTENDLQMIKAATVAVNELRERIANLKQSMQKKLMDKAASKSHIEKLYGEYYRLVEECILLEQQTLDCDSKLKNIAKKIEI